MSCDKGALDQDNDDRLGHIKMLITILTILHSTICLVWDQIEMPGCVRIRMIQNKDLV